MSTSIYRMHRIYRWHILCILYIDVASPHAPSDGGRGAGDEYIDIQDAQDIPMVILFILCIDVAKPHVPAAGGREAGTVLN